MSLSVRKTPRGLEESLTKTSTMHTSTGGYYDSRSDKDVQSVFDLYDRFLFPMITEINRCCPTYAIVFYPSMLFIFAQLFLSGFFTYYDFEGNVSGIFQIFRKIFFFGLGCTYAQMKVSQFVLPCINYLSILTLIVIFISYNNSHEFSSWHKFVLRNWHGGFAIILLIPHLYSFVSSMSSYINDNGEHMYECFIMNLISVIYAIFELLFLSIPLLSSPFLSNVKTILWRPNEFIMGILYIAVPITLMAFDNPKEKWSLLLSPILLFILSPFAFKFFISFPFSGIVFNALSISMPIFLDIMAFYAIIRLYIYMPPVLIRYLIPPVCYVIVNVIAVILFYRFRKKVKQTLTYNSADIEELEKNDIMKKEYFENMKPIPKYLIYFYLQVGLEEACDFFLDWSFSRYLIELYPGDDCILLFTTWLVFFFPSESSFLHSLVTLLFKIKNRTYFNNIVFYQLHRVHIFRQSSASPEVLTDFSRVRKASQLCVSTISQFWYGNSTVYNDIDSVFPYLAHHRKTADTLWIEMLDKYPNHAGFAKQYSSYLLDAKSKFLEAIFWHQKATALENGSIGQNDKMFSRFVRAFPFYLKSGIVDTGGNLRRGAGKQANIARKGSFNTVSSSGHSSTDGSFDIDIEEAQTFLPLMNLRIAVERAIEGCSLKSVSFITWTSLFRLILSSAFVIIVYYVLVHATDKNLLLFNSVSKFFEVSNYLNLLSVEIVQFYFEAVDGMHYEPSKIVDPYINFTADINLTIVNLTRMAITEMDNFIRGIFETGNVNGIGDLMSEQLIDNHICDENANLVVINQSITIDYFIRSHLLNLINLAKDNFTSRKSYNQDPSFCQFFVKTQILQTIMENLTSYVSNIYDKAIETDLLNNMNKSTHYELESSKMDSTESLCAFFISLSPFILFFLSVPSLMSLSVGIKNRRTKIRLIIESIPLDDRIEAAKTIRPDLFANSEENLLIPKQFKQNICGPWFFLFISTMLVSLLCVINAIVIYEISLIFQEIQEHSNLYNLQRFYLYDLGRCAAFGAYLYHYEKNGSSFPFSSFNVIKRKINFTREKYSDVLIMLSIGYFNISAANGYDSDIDKFRTQELCLQGTNSTSSLDFFNCISYDRLKDSMLNLMNNLLASIETNTHESEDVRMILLMLETRIASGYQKIFDMYVDKYHDNYDLIVNLSIGFLCINLLVIWLTYSIEHYQQKKFHDDYETFKELMLRIQPFSFVSNSTILNYLLNQNDHKDNQMSSGSQTIFTVSSDAMIFLNTKTLIENTNLAATTIFGYTSDQLLGQKLAQLFPAEVGQNSQIFSTIQLMISGQSKMVYEFDGTGQKDDGSSIQMRIVLIGFAENRRNADSFALVCKDLTVELRERSMVEEAKRRSDHILLQLVPKEILSKLQKGEKEIAFTIPSASFCFADIEKFSAYSQSLTTPQDVLKSISLIFTTFDKIAATFDSITKIKVIGDCYFAGAGLFASTQIPDSYANIMIQFGLQLIDSLEDLNLSINANLQIRVGVHTGGPVTVGILGPEKPIFDVFGFPVIVAAKLEKTGLPSSIHISEEAYQYVASENMNIEPAEDIEVNGQIVKTFSVIQSIDSSRSIGMSRNKSLIGDQGDLTKSGVLLQEMVNLSDSFIT